MWQNAVIEGVVTESVVKKGITKQSIDDEKQLKIEKVNEEFLSDKLQTHFTVLQLTEVWIKLHLTEHNKYTASTSTASASNTVTAS